MGISFISRDGLFMLLSTDKDFYVRGEPVRLTLFKVNLSSSPISLTYPSTQRYDFAVVGPIGEVWRWSHERAFLPVVQTVTLQPGQFQIYTEIWRQTDFIGRPVPPGIYRVFGWNTFEGFRTLPALDTTISISA